MKEIFRIALYALVTPAVLYGLFLLTFQYRSYFCKSEFQEIFVEEGRPTFRIYAKNSDAGNSFCF